MNKKKQKRFEEIINMLHLDNDIIEETDEKWYLYPFDIWFYPKDPDKFYFVIDEIAENYSKPYLGEGKSIDNVYGTWNDSIDKDFLQMYKKAVEEYNIKKIKTNEKDTQMKIKITEDSNNYLDQMFQDNLKTYNYIKTDILLYLIYGENVKWTYVQEEDTFYIKQFNNYLTELNKTEWKELFAENSISIDKSRTNISIKSSEDIEEKFLKLLNDLEVKYTIARKKTKLNQILSGEKKVI